MFVPKFCSHVGKHKTAISKIALFFCSLVPLIWYLDCHWTAAINKKLKELFFLEKVLLKSIKDNLQRRQKISKNYKFNPCLIGNTRFSISKVKMLTLLNSGKE